MAHYVIGLHLPAGDPERQQHLTRAYTILDSLNANYELALVEQAMQTN